jgi:tellurite resistance protein
MLLDELTMEEKKAFWNIANVLASVDGSVMEEVSILNQYNEEMGVNFAFIDASLVDVKKEIESIKSGSLRNRKIVYFELFGVAYADTEFDDKEKAVLDEVSAGLDIADDDREVLEQSVKTIYDTYRKIGEVLDV